MRNRFKKEEGNESTKGTPEEIYRQKLLNTIDKGTDVSNIGNPSSWQKETRKDRPTLMKRLLRHSSPQGQDAFNGRQGKDE